MRLIWILLSVSLLGLAATMLGRGQNHHSQVAPVPSEPTASSTNQSRPTLSPPSACYTLSPERRAKAVAYSRALYVLYFGGTLVSLGIYLLLWRTRIAGIFRDGAQRVSPRLIVQCLIFVPLFVATAALLNFPFEYYYGYSLEHRFGLSTQGFASWLGDWGKSMAITGGCGVIVAWVFYTAVRRSPRRWWFYFWLASIPLMLAFLLVEPYWVEPLFYRFTPLEKTDPSLVERIEAMLNHAGLSIPPARILEMDASSKTRTIDA